MRNLIKRFSVLVWFTFVIVGCGGTQENQTSSESLIKNEAVVIKSRATFDITTVNRLGIQPLIIELNLSNTQPISVTNSASSTMTVDNSLFIIPTISSTLLNFGYLQLSALQDNNLSVCGTGGTTKCGTAFIRTYTTGTTGAGLYNSVGGYGAPLTGGQSTLATVGLNVAGAAVLQTLAISPTKYVVHLSDFPNPKYNIKADFTNAGAGSYATTLVIEYGLSP